MMTLLPVVLCALIAAQQPPVAIRGAVIDGHGKPAVGAEVVFSAGMAIDGSVPILERATTDGSGRFNLPRPVGKRLLGFSSEGVIWARKTGFGLGIIDLARRNRPSESYRVILEPPQPRRLIFRDHAGNPLAGLRAAPRLVRTEQTIFLGVTVPDEWLEEIAVTTATDGTAVITSLDGSTELKIVRAATPARGIHYLGLPHGQATGDATLIMSRPSQLAGTVIDGSGAPVAGVGVEMWVRCGVPARGEQTIYTTPEPIRLSDGPIRTDAGGSFQTPSLLLGGSTYRVVAKAPGFAPSVSDWITLSGPADRLPPITLRRLRTLMGLVVDRQMNPIAGALMSQPGGPTTTTDAAGRFRLKDALPGPSFLLARTEGFRVQGWLIEPHETGELELTLSRPGEPPVQMKATLPPPLSQQQSRSLARRVIDPYMKDALAKGDDTAKVWTLRALRWIDPTAFVELAQKTKFRKEAAAANVLGQAALTLAATDLEEASAIAESIPNLADRCDAMVGIVDFLPAAKRADKLGLLDRAAFLARSSPYSREKLYVMGEVGERWVELHETAKARAIFAEGRKLVEALPMAKRTDAGSFLARLARVEPSVASQLIENVGTVFWRERIYANMAIRLAYEHPASAEEVLGRLQEPIWHYSASQRICRRLATIDAPRARRIAASLPDPAERAYAWAFLADGLSATDRKAAQQALDRAIREIDVDIQRNVSWRTDANPAASILPFVESIAPDRLAEVFWRAVALHPMPGDPRTDLGMDEPSTPECLLLSRYDREVAAILLEPVAAYARSRTLRRDVDISPCIVEALAAIDPAAAIALVEALPPAKTLDINERANLLRHYLSEQLSLPSEHRWISVWRFYAGCAFAMFEELDRNL